MTLVQALVLAILQGFSELFPISSLGHTILIPALLHWDNIHRSDPSFLAFVVVLHLGTALALIVFYWREWVAIVKALFASLLRGRISNDPNEKLGWLLVVGTIPVGILGILLKDPVRQLFGTVTPVAIFLMINGVLMFAGEALKRRQHENAVCAYKAIAALTFPQSILVGFGQALALLPGI